MAGQTGVIPLLVSNVAWTQFLKNVAALTSHSPTSSIDSSNLKLGDYARFLVSLAEFQSSKEQEPLKILRDNEHLLRHLFFGFLIDGSSTLIFRIMELTDLDITTTKRTEKGKVAVVSGTLYQWKAAIITCLNQELVVNYELRWTFNQILNYFQQFGLRNIFDDYRQKGLKDQTFLLEYKG